jgi:Zn-dependent protease with chaperone function
LLACNARTKETIADAWAIKTMGPDSFIAMMKKFQQENTRLTDGFKHECAALDDVLQAVGKIDQQRAEELKKTLDAALYRFEHDDIHPPYEERIAMAEKLKAPDACAIQP